MKRIVMLCIAAFLLSMSVFTTTAAFATDSTKKEKIGVCHRTASDSNPYVFIEVPEDEANGHITGTDKQHNEKVTWKSDGTFRGVDHKDGDLKLDYYASNKVECDDNTPPPPHDECPNLPGDQPEGTDCTPVTETPNPCPNGDFNGDEPGCGTPPTENPCPNGDFNGDAEGCGTPPTDTPTPTDEPTLGPPPVVETPTDTPTATETPVTPTVVHAGLSGLPETGGPNVALLVLGIGFLLCGGFLAGMAIYKKD